MAKHEITNTQRVTERRGRMLQRTRTIGKDKRTEPVAAVVVEDARIRISIGAQILGEHFSVDEVNHFIELLQWAKHEYIQQGGQ